MNRLPRAKKGYAEPLVTVLMPARNCDQHVAETIESVLSQSYRNFEFLIVNDCSTDNTAQVISSYKDPRIRTLENPTNFGVARSLLRGVEASRGMFIARIDADDVCLRSRLSRQVRYMQKHPEVGVLGGNAILIGQPPMRMTTVPRRDQDIKAELLFRTPVIHPAVMFRKAAIPFWYDPEVGSAEDYDLWARLASEGVIFANLAHPVIRYRLHSQRTSVVRAHEQRSESRDVKADGLSRLLGTASAADLEAFSALGQPRSVDSDLLVAAADLAVRIVRKNDELGTWSRRSLRQRVSRELAVLTALNVRRLPALSALETPARSVLRKMVLSNLFSVASGLWYAISRKAGSSVQAWGNRDA